MPGENTQGSVNDLPSASQSEEAEIRALLIEQGAIEVEAPDKETETPQPDEVFDDPEEAAAADQIAAEARGEKADEEAKPAEAPAKTEEVAKTEETPEDDAPSVARGLASLARRESKLVERERQTMLVAKENQDLKMRMQGIARQALEDPAGFYAALGEKDLSRVAAHLFYTQNPDQAPPEFKDRAERIQLERRVQMMQRQMEEQQAQQVSAAQQQVALNYLHAVAQNIPENLPYLREEALDDPQGVARAMYGRMVEMRDRGELLNASTDEEIAAVVADRYNKDLEYQEKVREKRMAARAARKAGTSSNGKTAPPAAKTPAPVAEEKKSAPKSITSKNATAHTRPRREAVSHEDDIESVINDLKAGRASG